MITAIIGVKDMVENMIVNAGAALIGLAGDGFRTLSKAGTAVIEAPFQLLSDPDENLATVRQIFCRASNGMLRSLVSRVAERTEEAVVSQMARKKRTSY